MNKQGYMKIRCSARINKMNEEINCYQILNSVTLSRFKTICIKTT